MQLASVDSLPPPCELGGPAKFTSWRAEQVDALLRLTESDKRFSCYNIPTGGGKSILASMAGRVLGGRTLILTATKALQDQIFERDKLTDVDIRGQQNYECLAVRPYGPLSDYGNRYGAPVSVDRGPCHVGVHCWMKFNGCTYFEEVRRARETTGVISSNYDYWLALGKSVRDGRAEEQLGKFDLLICDEAHDIVNKVCSSLQIKLPRVEISNLLGLQPLPVNAPVDRWRNWAAGALVGWGDEMDRLSGALRGSYIDSDTIDEYKTMQQIGLSLEQISELAGDWIVGESWRGEAITFDPVWPTSYTEQLLFRGIPKVVFLSATITPKALDVIGTEKSAREFVEYQSSFPLARRPVYILSDKNTPRVDFRMSEHDEWLWIELIDAFIGKRVELGRKGIIHCVSYARMERIKQLSKFRKLFITNSDSSETRDAIDKFKKSSDGILLSPSVSTGEDFPDDECRWIVVAKLPFNNSKDPIAKRREQLDKGHGGFEMMTRLAQSVGRGMRSMTDWCEAVVVDAHSHWAMNAFEQHAPKYFRQAWRWTRTLPAPLEVGEC